MDKVGSGSVVQERSCETVRFRKWNCETDRFMSLPLSFLLTGRQSSKKKSV